jgi:hypothetical protein
MLDTFNSDYGMVVIMYKPNNIEGLERIGEIVKRE